MDYIMEKSWSDALAPKFDSEYKHKLFNWLNQEYATKTIYPPKAEIFNALNFVPINQVKVVIIGQDPYHTEGQAHGLAFSCHNGTPQPSLKNIFKEIHNDLGLTMSNSTDLTPWARQGVVLLNTSLTVVAHQPASHANELPNSTLPRTFIRHIRHCDRISRRRSVRQLSSAPKAFVTEVRNIGFNTHSPAENSFPAVRTAFSLSFFLTGLDE